MPNLHKPISAAAFLLIALLVLQTAGCQPPRSNFLPAPPTFEDISGTLMVVQKTNVAYWAQLTQIAASTPEPEGVRTYCESTFKGTRTPDECRTWVNRVMEVYPADIAYCQHTEGEDFGDCLRIRHVPLPE
ncbi:MAG: hypothetical protein ABI700_13065 [Chloroflexota bacterium]